MNKRVAALLAVLLWAMAGVARGEPGDARILEAREAARRGDGARLQALAAEADAHVLAPYVRYWALAAQLANDREPLDAQPVREFLLLNEGDWLAEKLRGDWLRRLARQQDWDAFMQEFAALAQPDQELRCMALAQQLGGGDPAALPAAQELWESTADLPEACTPVLATLVANGQRNGDDVRWRLRRLVEAKRPGEARSTAGWSSAGVSAVRLKEVFDNPAKLLARPGATEGEPARELAVLALARLARQDARAAVLRWHTLGPERFSPDQRGYIAGQLGWMLARSQQPDALEWFARASGPLTEEQHEWRVRAALRAGDWAQLITAVEAMPPAQAQKPDWLYWYARALRAAGREAEAAALFARAADGTSFYAILAREALGGRLVWPQAGAPVSAQELAQAQTQPGLARALALLRLDLRTEAVREWNWSLRGVDDRRLLAAAELARRAGWYDRAIYAAERTRTQHDYGLRYLAPHYDAVVREAGARGLDLAWVYGLMRQESRFVTIARSGAGAQGLMQVMPDTGRWIAKRNGWNDYHPGWLTQLDTNVKLGTAYLQHVLEGLDDHPVLASAAYNAGPGRARRWRDTRALEGAVYAETIPFSETRDYVKKVMANTVAYATLFTGKPASLTERLGRVSPGTEVAAGQGCGPGC